MDVQLLKDFTEYSGCSQSDQHIKWFWELLAEDFTEVDKMALLRFSWGRNKLPLNREAFSRERKFRIAGLSRGSGRGSQDGYMPESHTCFFTIDLPRYSSKAIMKERCCMRFTSVETSGMVESCLSIETAGYMSAVEVDNVL